jgi:predicted regulator of Ras-like GTPase activity (Roadblock/LC7/MglB family)
MEAIDKSLERLHWETEAQCVLLADISGQLISERGVTGRINTAVLSALAAGELAATKEMASLVGEEARFRMVLHEGWQNSVYLSEVGEEMLLITIFNNNTPIGMVRLFTREVVAELAAIIVQSEPVAEEEKDTDDFDDDFGTLLLGELDEIEVSFGES